MTRVELRGRIPGGPRPTGAVIGEADSRYVRVRWDDGMVCAALTQHLRVMPEPQATVYYDDGEWSAVPIEHPWQVDCERDGRYVGTAEFDTEDEARAYAARWYR